MEPHLISSMATSWRSTSPASARCGTGLYGRSGDPHPEELAKQASRRMKARLWRRASRRPLRSLLSASSKRQRHARLDLFQHHVASDIANAGNAEHEVVEESVVGRHVLHDDAQMVIGIARGRKALQHLAPRGYPRDELVDEFCVVPFQRDVEDRGHRKAGLLARDEGRIALDGTALLQRAHPAPARRRRHTNRVGELLVGGAAVLLKEGENPRVLVFDHGYRQNGLFHPFVRDIGQFYHNEPATRKYW